MQCRPRHQPRAKRSSRTPDSARGSSPRRRHIALLGHERHRAVPPQHRLDCAGESPGADRRRHPWESSSGASLLPRARAQQPILGTVPPAHAGSPHAQSTPAVAAVDGDIFIPAHRPGPSPGSVPDPWSRSTASPDTPPAGSGASSAPRRGRPGRARRGSGVRTPHASPGRVHTTGAAPTRARWP
jgi:hypothetical protein